MFFHIFSLYFTFSHFFSLLKLFLPKKVCWKPPLIWDPTETLILFSLPKNVNIVYPCWPTSARTNFPLTKAAKKGWGNLEPGASKDPCPFELASWIALDMVRRGLCYFAAAVMLSFDTYIRPGKLCELVAGNVVPPPRGVHRKYCHWTLLLHPQESAVPSKVGQFNDSLVVGSHGREWIGNLLGRIYSAHPGDLDSQLFDFTLNRFEKEFKLSVSRLGIQKLQLSPHCLRHGGASHDYLFGIRSLPDVQARGCWGSYESVRRYAKHGRINRQLNLLTPEQQQTAKQSHLELPQILLKCFWALLSLLLQDSIILEDNGVWWGARILDWSFFHLFRSFFHAVHCFDLSCNGCTERIGCMLFRRDVDSADLTWPSALLEKEMLQHWCCHPSSFDGINESAWAHSLVMGDNSSVHLLNCSWLICARIIRGSSLLRPTYPPFNPLSVVGCEDLGLILFSPFSIFLSCSALLWSCVQRMHRKNRLHAFPTWRRFSRSNMALSFVGKRNAAALVLPSIFIWWDQWKCLGT